MKDKIGELLGELAAKLGVTIDHLWGVLVAQVHNQAVKVVALYVLLVITTAIAAVIYRRLYAKRDSYCSDNFAIGSVMAGAILFIFWVAAICKLDTLLAMFNNPEYIALKNVLGMISGN